MRATKSESAGPYAVNDAERVPRSAVAPIEIAVAPSLSRDALDELVMAGTLAVDLVHEDQRRDAEPLEGAHEHPGLGLNALHGRDDEHGPVEDVEHPFDLGDEVRVAGSVDEVDGDVVDGERDDGGLDRDTPLAFERERIGLSAACVDAADLVDDAGGVEQPLGQAGLTGVDVGQDPQIEHSHRERCPRDRWK